jgi:hypothetical protein
MTDGPAIAIAIVMVVIIYVIAKVKAYSSKSEQQWREVDKSKLKPWDDDDLRRDRWLPLGPQHCRSPEIPRCEGAAGRPREHDASFRLN